MIPGTWSRALQELFNEDTVMQTMIRNMYAEELITLMEKYCKEHPEALSRDGYRIILRHDIYSDMGGHVLDCEKFNRWCNDRKLRDLVVEQAPIEDCVMILHKDSLEYRYLRPVLAL